ncbi:MAG: methionine--tRNA ligase [Euryarchaeota archaeon RBG_16_67_27]|nr:MAG: methionine--tRNA ligase [Euryarchaeota archaeon RBG_16_67_27]
MAKVLVCVAWPYASGPRHLGHAVSTFIPADVFARYHRMKGDEVLVVGGSDMHGTPTTVRADEEGVPPSAIAGRFHALHAKNIEELGVRYDLYWNTADPNHKAQVQEIFLALRSKDHVYEATMVSPFCTTDGRFLPDRYVEGTCPNCGYDRARGDQCDNCGRLWDPFELKDPKCRIHGTPPVPKETNHFFFRLSAFEESLKRWMASGKDHWRHHVLTFTNSWLKEGLRDRAVTRDLDWGIEVPVAGFDSKRIYVWFEAVMGYLTATQEWYRRAGRPEGWRDFWYDPATRHYYFVGKDNIIWHTIIWPAILAAYDDRLVRPYDVPATQYLNVSGEKMSAGRGKGVWLPDLLERFDPDQIRYYGIATMPETKDTDFSWADFAQRNNSELLAVYGNFVHRAITFADRNFEGKVPEAGFLDAADKAVLRAIEDQWRKVGQNLEYVHLKDALREAIHLARLGNQYIDQKAPWDLVRTDRAACATAIHVSLRLSRSLALLLAPFLPGSSSRLWHALGYDTDVHAQRWDEVLEDVPPGQRLRVSRPLFTKIELDNEAAGAPSDRFDVRVARILEVRPHPNADKLYVLDVDLGDERRQVVAGIKSDYAPDELRGRTIAFLANLQPAKLRGVQSNGMLLAGEDDRTVGLVLPPADAPVGTQILGRRGAATLSFSEFQTYRLEVGEGGAVFFLGRTGEVRVPLTADGVPLRVDKGLREGTGVH